MVNSRTKNLTGNLHLFYSQFSFICCFFIYITIHFFNCLKTFFCREVYFLIVLPTILNYKYIILSRNRHPCQFCFGLHLYIKNRKTNVTLLLLDQVLQVEVELRSLVILANLYLYVVTIFNFLNEQVIFVFCFVVSLVNNYISIKLGGNAFYFLWVLAF